MGSTREARRPAPARSARAHRTADAHAEGVVAAALQQVVSSFRARDEEAVQSMARFALGAGASVAEVADVVLREVARVTVEGAGVLVTSDTEMRARRVLCRLQRPSGRDGRPVLLFTDHADSTSVAFEVVLEAAGSRVFMAVTPDPSEVLGLVSEQPWDEVVVDHSSLRRSARRARDFLAPLLSTQPRPHVVVTSEALDLVDLTDRAVSWVPRELRSLVAAAGVLPEDPLTERERDVLRAVAAGRSNEQIGRQLQLSLSTVKTYLERIHAKLGSVDRASAVAVAVRGGWI